MEIVYVAQGERAPDDADVVTINQLPSGKVGFTGAIRTGATTYNFIHSNDLETAEEAEKAALMIAEQRGSVFVYVERPDA